MVYYLSSGRNSYSSGHSNSDSTNHSNDSNDSNDRKYGLSDMSVENLKKHQVGPVSALVLLAAIPIAVLVLSMIIGFSMKPSYMSEVDPTDATKRVAHKGKVFGFSLLYALIAGGIAFAVVKSMPDSPTAA